MNIPPARSFPARKGGESKNIKIIFKIRKGGVCQNLLRDFDK